MGHQTINRHLVFRTLIEHCETQYRPSQREKLHAWFFDFKKAADTMPCDIALGCALESQDETSDASLHPIDI